MRLLWAIACLAIAASVSQTSVAAELPEVPKPALQSTLPQSPEALQVSIGYTQRPYVLGPNDRLNIAFLGAPDLDQRDLRVGPDGHLMLPAIGAVYVNGQTVQQLTAELNQRYATYLNQPQIAVNLAATKPYIVQLAGAILKPGPYEFNTNPSFTGNGTSVRIEGNIKLERTTPVLSNALLTAGGITFDADLEHVKIENHITGEHFEVNLFELLQGDIQYDAVLAHGDIVTVPRLSNPLGVDPERYKVMAGATFAQESIPVRVFGFVNRPGLVQVSASQSPRLSTAIAQAFGYYEQDFPYPPDKVLLSRLDQNGSLVTTTVNPKREDPLLMANDIVYVPQKAVPKTLLVFRSIGTVLQPILQTAANYNSWALVFDPTRNFR